MPHDLEAATPIVDIDASVPANAKGMYLTLIALDGTRQLIFLPLRTAQKLGGIVTGTILQLNKPGVGAAGAKTDFTAPEPLTNFTAEIDTERQFGVLRISTPSVSDLGVLVDISTFHQIGTGMSEMARNAGYSANEGAGKGSDRPQHRARHATRRAR